MEKLQTIKELLLKIKRTPGWPRKDAISSLQNTILDEPGTLDEELRYALSELAGDLNFYEDEPLDRDEALGYYGDDKLVEVIDTAIKKIEDHEEKR